MEDFIIKKRDLEESLNGAVEELYWELMEIQESLDFIKEHLKEKRNQYDQETLKYLDKCIEFQETREKCYREIQSCYKKLFLE